jgi:ABC-2 type transport system ATP-binding protein
MSAATPVGVGKDYPFFSLPNVNLAVPEGRTVGFIGRNGAGKSTTTRILMSHSAGPRHGHRAGSFDA